jgi:enoyl-CoA hydratase/carnithine racemase
LTLSRKQSLNAMSQEMMRSLEFRLGELGGHSGLRAVIITGEGHAFCAGGDLKEFEQALRTGGTTLIDTLRYNQGVLQQVEDLPVPVIGAVNDIAVAGGLELLLCCGIIIAAEGAKLGDGHARYAVRPRGRRDRAAA